MTHVIKYVIYQANKKYLHVLCAFQCKSELHINMLIYKLYKKVNIRLECYVHTYYFEDVDIFQVNCSFLFVAFQRLVSLSLSCFCSSNEITDFFLRFLVSDVT